MTTSGSAGAIAIEPGRSWFVPRWNRVRRQGKLAFLFRVGIPGVGVPAALAFNLLVLWVRGELDLWASVYNALELTYTMLLVAPLVGAIAGNAIWTRAERQWGAGALRVSTDLPEPVGAPDEEQRRLSALRDEVEREAAASPASFTRRVVGFALLGYTYILAVAALMAAAVAWLVAVEGQYDRIALHVAVVLGSFTVVVLSSLGVRLLEPRGRRITAAGSPELFKALEPLCRSMRVPLPDVVLVDDEMNASASEVPRFGLFGPPKRILVVGLPLLESLPADECRAILAHELAHLSRRHGRGLRWIVRLTVAWTTLARTLEFSRSWTRPLFLPFFRWYAPRFECHAQALSRRTEYESDRLAAEAVGPELVARALLRVHVTGRFLSERIMPAIRRHSAVSAEPPARAFQLLGDALAEGPPRTDMERWIGIVLADRTFDAEAHPSLAERMATLGLDLGTGQAATAAAIAVLDNAAGPRGSIALLGDVGTARLRGLLEQDWQLAIADQWRSWHADARVWQESPGGPAGAGSIEAMWARARWAADCEPRSVALPLMRDIVQRDPDHVEGSAYLGRLLAESELEHEREEGIVLLEQVLRRDTALVLLAGASLKAHYARLGRRPDVDRILARERQVEQRMLRGLRERHELRTEDELEAYRLPVSMMQVLQRACASQPDILRAFLVRKETEFLRDQACVFLAVECEVPWYKPALGADAIATCEALVRRMSLPEFGDFAVLPVARGALKRRIQRVPGAEIYRRAG